MKRRAVIIEFQEGDETKEHEVSSHAPVDWIASTNRIPNSSITNVYAKVSPILEGIVVDHLKPHDSELLYGKIEPCENISLLGINLDSSKMAKKDVLKIECPLSGSFSESVAQTAFSEDFAHDKGPTVNYVSGGCVVAKSTKEGGINVLRGHCAKGSNDYRIPLIKSGMTIDHISEGNSLELYEHLESISGVKDCLATIGIRLPTKKNESGKKDILKIEKHLPSIDEIESVFDCFGHEYGPRISLIKDYVIFSKIKHADEISNKWPQIELVYSLSARGKGF